MKEKIKKSLISLAGDNLKVKENKKSLDKKHKKFFLDTIYRLENINSRSEQLHTDFGMNIVGYEDNFFILIEDFVYELWGSSVASVVFWWVSEVHDPKKKDYYMEDQLTGKRYIVRTPTQVYNTLKKLKLFKNL